MLKTGLTADGESAVVIAPLSSTKPSGTTPNVDAKTMWAHYRVLVGQAKTVKVAEIGTTWYGPNALDPSVLDAALKQLP
ncbi:hypothetical protein BBK82_30285 [Lentzea guizhouensis]|uniref:Uncharacterized protein n=1 Tax=Lentzea guizhouensis TaxID=1586287 RepID=A0A1B2HPN7_9PSEU|nr:hypothetical protein BBK82_30285 [Lentzea guizhouensis]